VDVERPRVACVFYEGQGREVLCLRLGRERVEQHAGVMGMHQQASKQARKQATRATHP
jgi:hypothetical protein